MRGCGGTGHGSCEDRSGFGLAWPRPASDSVDNQEAFLGEALLPRQGAGHGIASLGRLGAGLVEGLGDLAEFPRLQFLQLVGPAPLLADLVHATVLAIAVETPVGARQPPAPLLADVRLEAEDSRGGKDEIDAGLARPVGGSGAAGAALGCMAGSF